MGKRSIGLRIAALALATAVGQAALVAAATAAPATDNETVHLALAKAAAGTDLSGVLTLCDPRSAGAPAPVPNDRAEPMKIFDNLYFVGIPSVSAWALTTSDGIIMIDSLDNPHEAETFIVGGLKKLGLDPGAIKYVVITHAHGDHYGGAQYLADMFHAHVVMSDIDWNTAAARTHFPANWGPVPKRDIAVKDGDTLTLGDTTIAFTLTPPHTPGAISIILPLRDGDQKHVGGLSGGVGLNFPPTPENFVTYVHSAERFAKIARAAGVDVLLSNHSTYDEAFQKMEQLKTRKPGAPHPFVMGMAAEQRSLTVAAECAKAADARTRALSGPTPP